MTSEELANNIKNIIIDKKGIDVISYDCRGKSELTDFFIIATATSTPHLKALLNEMHSSLKNLTSFIVSGTPESGWIAVDCYDVIIHLFKAELRTYYSLDDLLKKIAS